LSLSSIISGPVPFRYRRQHRCRSRTQAGGCGSSHTSSDNSDTITSATHASGTRE
jgi:hypothetical protein